MLRDTRTLVSRPLAPIIGGMAAGALGLYLLDPALGRRRRHALRDHVEAAWCDFTRLLDRGARDLAHRARGLLAKANGVAHRRDRVDDQVLVERVRTKLGRVVSHPHAIEVSANDGTILLVGPILAAELPRTLAAVERVAGVCAVENRLLPHERPGNVPGLQGPTRRGAPRFELLQQNWSPAARLLVGTAGLGLLGAGLRRGGLAGLGGLSLGSALLARAAVNLPMKRLLGLGAGRRAIDLEKTIMVHAPIEEVFALFRDFRNFPRFMRHVRDVRVSDGHTHWMVEGPAGIPVRFETETTRMEPNHLLGWRSLPSSRVELTGMAYFEPVDGGTRLHIRMSYNPPAGALGHAIALLFHKDPKHALDDDLLRFKSLLETGKARGHGEQITREDLGAPQA